MKTFEKWLETHNKSSMVEVGSYKVEISDNGDGKLLLTVTNRPDSSVVDSKGIIRKMVDVSGLQTSPSIQTGKVTLTAPEIKAPMMDRMEPMDNRGAGGLPSP